MIDTVRLIIDAGSFCINQPERFQPNAKTILGLGDRRLGARIVKAFLNPSKQEFGSAYYPRLTLRRRPPLITELAIEFSIPKLLYGNNFDELTEEDFEVVLKVLAGKLADVGVLIFSEQLRNASVGAIHYGKNIILPRHTLCASVIRLFAKAPAKQWFDTNRVEYRNDGHLYKIHTNSFELAFYDKVKDLQKARYTERRAHEPDNDIQMGLLEYFEVAMDTQVLRMEARLNTRGQIRGMLKAINMPDDDLRFFALFRKEIAQKALLHYWEPYKAALPLVAMAQRENPSSIMNLLIKYDPEASTNTQLQRLGAMMLVGEIGWNGLRSYFQGIKGFERLKKDLASFANGDENPLTDLETIDATLRGFEPVKMEKHLQSGICDSLILENSR
jgi:hypothetical protein